MSDMSAKKAKWPSGSGESGSFGGAESVERGEVSKGESTNKWYSVAEAAEYLQISQPTIFRWMKDGTLSFYKVGGSTRFSREGLDAVIEKTTGRREAEVVQSRCSACGNDTLVPGQLQGTGRLYFRPEKSKFWVFEHSLVPVTAKVCTACGYMQIHADTSKLNRLVKDEK